MANLHKLKNFCKIWLWMELHVSYLQKIKLYFKKIINNSPAKLHYHGYYFFFFPKLAVKTLKTSQINNQQKHMISELKTDLSLTP